MKSYPNIAIEGSVRPHPIKNTAPGRTSIVAIYTLVYRGPYTRGNVASVRPRRELILPGIKITD